MNKILVITGQTATGKTKLALDYAKKLNGELINCDSRQIYKKLDIITGKDLHVLTGAVKIWLYDVVDPKKRFSSYDYQKLAKKTIKDILNRGKILIIVGGAYFYLSHLLYGINTNIAADWKLRKKLESKSVAGLQNTLNALNPQTLKQMNESDRKNPRRLIRRIEIARAEAKRSEDAKFLRLGIPSEARRVPTGDKNLRIELLGLRFKNKEKLISAIKKRVEGRIKMGAFQEVEKLLAEGYNEKDPGLQTIGYKQLISYFKGDYSKDEAIKKWVTAEIQYAKRQYTFMKKDRNIKWIDVD